MAQYIRKATISTLASLIAAALAYYLSWSLMAKIGAFQEYHKSVISLAAIFLAFSPAFYALLYSSQGTQERILKLDLKDSLDIRFRLSTISAFTLVLASLLGVITSYTMDDLANTVERSVNAALFGLSSAALLSTTYWTFLYGRLALNIVAHLMR